MVLNSGNLLNLNTNVAAGLKPKTKNKDNIPMKVINFFINRTNEEKLREGEIQSTPVER
jgi:hypothetical protein